LPVVAALRSDLVLPMIDAVMRLAGNRYARALLADAEHTMRHHILDQTGVPAHPVEIAEVAISGRILNHEQAALTRAVRTACQRLHEAGLGLSWPIPQTGSDRPDGTDGPRVAP
jgi:hypothetical protein